MYNTIGFLNDIRCLHLALALRGRLERITEGGVLVLAAHLIEDLLHQLVPGRGLALAAHHHGLLLLVLLAVAIVHAIVHAIVVHATAHVHLLATHLPGCLPHLLRSLTPTLATRHLASTADHILLR